MFGLIMLHYQWKATPLDLGKSDNERNSLIAQ